MLRKEFERLIAEEFPNAVPEKFRHVIQNVAFLVEDEAPSKGLLGLYHGVPATDRGDHYGVGATLPDTITLYQKTIEEEAREIYHSNVPQNIGISYEVAVRKIIRDTIWHEVAHHFGYNESQVRTREKKRNDILDA